MSRCELWLALIATFACGSRAELDVPESTSPPTSALRTALWVEYSSSFASPDTTRFWKNAIDWLGAH